VADVGPDELAAAQIVRRGDYVDAYDPVDRGIIAEQPREAGPEVAGDARHHDDLGHRSSLG
jgi:hypothetical protein